MPCLLLFYQARKACKGQNALAYLASLTLTKKYEFYEDMFRQAEAGLLNKGLMLSSSFRCDQIYKYEIYNFGHTMLCYLSRT